MNASNNKSRDSKTGGMEIGLWEEIDNNYLNEQYDNAISKIMNETDSDNCDQFSETTRTKIIKGEVVKRFTETRLSKRKKQDSEKTNPIEKKRKIETINQDGMWIISVECHPKARISINICEELQMSKNHTNPKSQNPSKIRQSKVKYNENLCEDDLNDTESTVLNPTQLSSTASEVQTSKSKFLCQGPNFEKFSDTIPNFKSDEWLELMSRKMEKLSLGTNIKSGLEEKSNGEGDDAQTSDENDSKGENNKNL